MFTSFLKDSSYDLPLSRLYPNHIANSFNYQWISHFTENAQKFVLVKCPNLCKATQKWVDLGYSRYINFTANADGKVSGEGLSYDEYEVTQTVPSGYTCDSSTQTVSFTTKNNSLNTVSFTNKKQEEEKKD